VVSPHHIQAARERWGTPAALEFFVDFETVSDLNDDFGALPARGGQALVFMIGCGHVEAGSWCFEWFVAEELSVNAEAAIVEQWLRHMETTRLRLAPQLQAPLAFHWSHAEPTSLTNGLKSARERSPGRSVSWHEPNWFDFLSLVMRAEPVIVKGPMGFGLKTVAKSLKSHGLIETSWDDNITDGLGAMVGAWNCYEAAAAAGGPVRDSDLMQAIRHYNEVDCQVMSEIISYLRRSH
jgi:hypothetical protein